jgi:hypothetical protein
MMRRMLAFVFLVLALNFAWEMAQAGFFASMKAMPFGAASLLCLRAAFGDLAITALGFGVAALVARDARWAGSRRPLVPFFVYLTVGLSVTIAPEKYAIATGRWRYEARMPLILGVGLLPIAQWIVVPAVVFAVVRYATTANQALRSSSKRSTRN